eukprot:TRINITY_DN68625_c0_g1_i1.p1 TRINITY_DN68625_c0_g1~~TRINITY_DN68625_c0_g1_i1.p1  ORF type:complete len:570 (+),score=89.95 TRINITY_DN68625_c0_g1_i1:101-1810(+)
MCDVDRTFFGKASVNYTAIQPTQALVAAAVVVVAVFICFALSVIFGEDLPLASGGNVTLLSVIEAMWQRMPAKSVMVELVALTAVLVATARSGSAALKGASSAWSGSRRQAKPVPTEALRTSGIVEKDCAWARGGQQPSVNPPQVRLRHAIDMAIKADDLVGAGRVLEEAARSGPSPDVVAYNLVVRGHIVKGDLRGAERWFSTMQAHGLRPTLCSYNMILDALSKANQLERCEAWFEHMANEGLQADTISFGTIINARARRGDKEKAEAMLARMVGEGVQPDAVCYNGLVHACAVCGDAQGAENWAEEIRRKGLELTVTTYTAVIDACAKSGDVIRAEKWLERMEQAGIEPNIVSYGALLDACARRSDPERAERWYQQMVSVGIAPNSHTFSTIVTACSRAKDPKSAEKWLARAENADILDSVIYSGVIDAYSKIGDGSGAEAILVRMKSKGVKPHVVAYSALARAFSWSGNWKKVEAIVAEMEGAGVPYNEYVLFSLLMAYASGRPKQPERAEAAFRKAMEDGVPTNAHICGALARNIGRPRSNEIMKELSLRPSRHRGSSSTVRHG